MGQLLARTGQLKGALFAGQKIEGTVVEITSKMVILDIGAKAQGLVVDEEYQDSVDYIKKLSFGDKVWATVIVPETERGQSLLSLRDSAQSQAWDKFEKAFKNKEEVEFKILGVTRGGLSVVAQGIQAFVPTSHTSSSLSKDAANCIGKTFKGKVIELDKNTDKLVLSERAVSESEIIKEQEDALQQIKEGEKLKGKVVGVANFGVFVQVKIPSKDGNGVSIDGLVHLSELSWQKVTDPSKVLQEGEEVEVIVIGRESGKLALSIKQAQKDPWIDSIGKYPVDVKIRGKVVKIGDFGAFIELEPGIEGLLRLSKIPSGSLVKEGQEVECFVEDVDKKNRKIGLGLVLKTKPVGYK